jgi:hypothetical protein
MPLASLATASNHVLAIVEDEKQMPVAQEHDDAVCRIGMVHHESEGRSHRPGDERRVLQCPQIEETHLTFECRPHVMGQRDRDGCLADSAGTSERDEAVAQQSFGHFPQDFLSPDHPLQAVGQCDRRRRLGHGRRRCGCRRKPLYRSDKAITAARHVRDVARTRLPSPSASRSSAM